MLPSAGGAPEASRQAASQADDRVAVVDGPLDAQREQHDQQDRDPQLVAGGGRAPGAPAPRPGAGEAPGAVPRPSIREADPGAIVDSPTSNRSTANRVGAYGSTAGGGLALAPPDGAADGGAEALGAADASGSRTGVTV